MSRARTDSAFRAGDLLTVAAGALLGLALGYLAGESVGRVNLRRIAAALERWRNRPRRRPGPWTTEDTEWLEAGVLDALKRDVVLARRAVRVRALGEGIVELSGRVAHPSEVELAGDLVRALDGVDTVINHLLVTGVDDTVVRVPGPSAPRAARG